MPDDVRPAQQGHGWWPYVAPYFSFLLMVEVARRAPDELSLLMLALKPAVPLALIVRFWLQGGYPELRKGHGLSLGGALQDVAVGLGLTALWMAPYLLVPALRPDPAESFDPNAYGEDFAALALGLRLFGYALVTPLFEEIFIRSFVMRYADVYGGSGDFRRVPLARFSVRSLVATVVIFTMGHLPWEWWVAVPWVVLSNLWFYHRKNLWALILVHGVTNASLLGMAVFAGDAFRDADGGAISLWFFV